MLWREILISYWNYIFYQLTEFSLSSPNKPAVFIGLGIGFLWCCLTAISVAYLMSARGEMEEQRDMENLLAAEKADPLKASNGEGVTTDAAGNAVVDVKNDIKSVRRSSTVPMGDSEEDIFIEKTDSDESDDPFDQTKNTRLAPTARVELSKSLNKQTSIRSLSELEAEEEAKIAQAYNPKRQSKRQSQGAAMRSVIVTSKENKAMLESDAKMRVGAKDQDGAPLRHSAGAKIMGKDAQRRSLTDNALKASLTAQRARARSIIEKSGEGLRSSGSSFRKSAKRTSESLRRSSTKGSSDNLEGLKQSSTSLKRSVRASSTGRQSMRASSTSRGRASSNGRASMRSSVRHGSSEKMRSSMRSKDRSSSNRRSVREEGLMNSDTQNRRHSGNID